jgi:catechol 2,3-dioxygenase-like lactoylglutathione lyase family enzyme
VIHGAKYVHTNLIARNWQALSRFYETVFGCRPVPPQRDLHGASFDAGTGLPNARARGIHLCLPGCGDDGPTLEIFEYAEPLNAESESAVTPMVNRPGLAHIAFAVASVADARQQVLDAGGAAVGEIVRMVISRELTITWCYVRDPEGNIVELQSRDSDLSFRGAVRGHHG